MPGRQVTPFQSGQAFLRGIRVEIHITNLVVTTMIPCQQPPRKHQPPPAHTCHLGQDEADQQSSMREAFLATPFAVPVLQRCESQSLSIQLSFTTIKERKDKVSNWHELVQDARKAMAVFIAVSLSCLVVSSASLEIRRFLTSRARRLCNSLLKAVGTSTQTCVRMEFGMSHSPGHDMVPAIKAHWF